MADFCQSMTPNGNTKINADVKAPMTLANALRSCLVIAVCFVIGLLLPAAVQHAERDEQYSEADKRPSKPQPTLLETQSGQNSDQNGGKIEGEEVKESMDWTNWIQALSAVAVAVFTYFLVRYSKRGWVTAEKSASAAYISSEAAKKTAEIAEAALSLEKQQRIFAYQWTPIFRSELALEIRFTVANSGRLPAEVLWLRADYVLNVKTNANSGFIPIRGQEVFNIRSFLFPGRPQQLSLSPLPRLSILDDGGINPLFDNARDMLLVVAIELNYSAGGPYRTRRELMWRFGDTGNVQWLGDEGEDWKQILVVAPDKTG